MSVLSKPGLLLGTYLLGAAGLAVAGSPSSLSDQRGYDNCVRAAQRAMPRINMDRKYYTNTYADAREFYLNGRARVEGSWGPVRISCKTSRSGHKVFAMTHQTGTYLGRTRVTVAGN